MFDIVPASWYAPAFFNMVLLLTGMKCTLLRKTNKGIFLFLFFFVIVLFGTRPLTFVYFGDTEVYAAMYQFIGSTSLAELNWDKDWLFDILMYLFNQLGLSVHNFFLYVASVYVGCSAWACKRLFGSSAYLAFLFVVGSFSFYGYGVNGIRNGMAAALTLLAFSYLKTNRWIALILSFVIIQIHGSLLLPVCAAWLSLFYKNTKFYLYCWLFSIVLSVSIGGALETYFASLNMVDDERFSSYLLNKNFSDQFSSTGFRWDFLLYSVMPIWLGWYVIIKRKIYNDQYLLLLHTYLLSNAFWIMLIRASFSNRFAYLSWFMYPIVLAYPLLILPVWRCNRRKIVIILMAHYMFTYLMWLIGKL